MSPASGERSRCGIDANFAIWMIRSNSAPAISRWRCAGLRRFAREGAVEELDLDDTIRSTARNAGYLELKMVPERHNAVKVLLFLDIGGSMDDHIRACEELFSAARERIQASGIFLLP
jgi:uncharacterized protein with von Willebrand factor type A (vWA) domain